MNRSEILKIANEYITKDRQSTHGDAEDSFANIANLWGAYLDKTIGVRDVAIMMTLLKIARYKKNPEYIDNAIDMAGYSAIAGELGGCHDLA